MACGTYKIWPIESKAKELAIQNTVNLHGLNVLEMNDNTVCSKKSVNNNL